MGLFGALVVAVCVCLCVCSASGERKKVSQEFSVRPAVDDRVQVSSGDVQCVFEWRDVTGGTGERWAITLQPRGNTGWECSVGRAVDSYLTFLDWKATLQGHSGPAASVSVYSGTGKELLRGAEYQVREGKGSLVVQPPEKRVRHSIQGVMMEAK